MTEDNIILIGKKPLMNYVTSIVMQFNIKKRDIVIVKARGKLITKAIEIVETVQRLFLKENPVEVSGTKIGSQLFDEERRTPFIEITLSRIKNV